MSKKALARSDAVTVRSGILRVSFKNRSVISITCWFSFGVLRSGPNRVTVMKSREPAAGEQLEILLVVEKRSARGGA